MVGSEDGMAHVCHTGTKKVVASLRHYEIPTTAMNQTDNDDDENIELPMSVEAVGFCPQNVNPNWCATGGADGVLKIWDLANDGQCRQTCRSATTSVAASSTTSKDDNAPSRGGLTSLRWHTSLPLVFTASSSGVVYLWDARNGRLLHSLTGHTDVINDMDVQFVDVEGCPGGTAIVTTASDDKTIRIFEVDVKAALLQQEQ
jgi:ribosome assembly protein SQT1